MKDKDREQVEAIVESRIRAAHKGFKAEVKKLRDEIKSARRACLEQCDRVARALVEAGVFEPEVLRIVDWVSYFPANDLNHMQAQLDAICEHLGLEWRHIEATWELREKDSNK